jgi:ATP-binding cassette, subfamily F, member 3
MIDIQNVSVARGGHDILVDVSFSAGRGDRVGVVGPNGAGKTTLFSLIIEELSPDRGNVSVQRGIRIGYLRQQLKGADIEDSLLDYAENALPALRNIEHQIDALEAAIPMQVDKERERSLRTLGELQTQFENSGGYELSMRAKTALGGLGFDHIAQHRPFNSFSGGWQMRAELARALVANPDLLLLDEPTNFLDIPAVEWLQKFLREFPGTLLLISHDRFMLNTLTTVTYEVAGCKLTRYGGNYEYYARERVRRHETLLAARKNQDRQRAQVERFIERFRAKNTKAALVQSRVKQLEKMEEIEVPAIALPQARIRVATPSRSGVEVMRLEDAGMTYDGTNWVLRHVDLRIQRGEKIGLVGLNGLGKTTLLRMLAGVLPPTEGRRILGHKVVPGYQAQDFSETMDPSKTLLETLKSAAPASTEQSIRGLLGSFLFSGDDIYKTVGVLSGGEKMRIAFARLLMNPPNFLLLDEPTTHLDIGSREMLERALQDYEGTLCVVSHDIEFVRHVATETIAMTPPGITRYCGGYDYYHEKMTQEQAVTAASAPKKSDDPNKGPSRKDVRRERAMQRKEIRNIQIPLERKIKAAEHRIAALEKEQKELADVLCASEEVKDYARINKRLSEIEAELYIETSNWEKAGLALEETKKE